MVGLNNTHKSFILILFAALLFVMPSAAINTAIYGDTAGFNPDLHKDTFTVVYSLPGSREQISTPTLRNILTPRLTLSLWGVRIRSVLQPHHCSNKR